jgi:2-oxoglutarate ferredoxin oxidoreductase subunit beta
MNTYGFHTIHGRAPAVATGLKASRPDLMVWVITGDGDALSIGGNHLLHVLRRNVDVKVVLFNNRTYGLTKGQYSPTSEFGKKGVKSAPLGVPDFPLNPLSVAIGAEATFVARTIDTDTRHLVATLERAAAHKGAAFVEVYQNCNIFNDGAFSYLTERDVHDDHTLYLEHGKPLLFGKERNRGIRLHGLVPEIVTIGTQGVTEADVLRHDEARPDANLAYILSRLDHPDFPVPVGVLRAVDRPTYDGVVAEQQEIAHARYGEGDLDAIFNSGDTWVVS